MAADIPEEYLHGVWGESPLTQSWADIARVRVVGTGRGALEGGRRQGPPEEIVSRWGLETLETLPHAWQQHLGYLNATWLAAEGSSLDDPPDTPLEEWNAQVDAFMAEWEAQQHVD